MKLSKYTVDKHKYMLTRVSWVPRGPAAGSFKNSPQAIFPDMIKSFLLVHKVISFPSCLYFSKSDLKAVDTIGNYSK